jgi:hypothetical protein
MGVAMLASSLGLSVADAKGLKRTFFDAFPKLGRFGEQLKQRCREVLIALDCQCLPPSSAQAAMPRGAWGRDGLTDDL